MPIFKLLIHAKPSDLKSAFNECGGAYVSCFIMADSIENSKQIAFDFLEGEKWIPLELEEYWLIKEADYKESEEGQAIYQHVLTVGDKYTFHTYPN